MVKVHFPRHIPVHALLICGELRVFLNNMRFEAIYQSNNTCISGYFTSYVDFGDLENSMYFVDFAEQVRMSHWPLRSASAQAKKDRAKFEREGCRTSRRVPHWCFLPNRDMYRQAV